MRRCDFPIGHGSQSRDSLPVGSWKVNYKVVEQMATTSAVAVAKARSTSVLESASAPLG
jgi:hypothetical protein